jgi:cytochrome b involved in lipid metabolism
MDGLIAAAAVLLGVLLVLLALRRNQARVRSHVAAVSAAAKPKRTLVIGKWTREEVAKHAAADDLWLIIQDRRSSEWRVYDMTDYVEEHPGGYAILNNAGGDATSGFHGPQHPPTVFDLLPDYYIGTLVDP